MLGRYLSRDRLGCCAALMWLLSSAVPAAEFSIEDRGLDGEARLYSVHCNDGSRRLLMHDYSAHRVCFIGADGEICAADFNLENMGKRACRTARRDRS